MSCGVGCRRGLDPSLLWLWHRPAAIAPIRPLARGPPYAVGAAQENGKKKKTRKIKTKIAHYPKHKTLKLLEENIGENLHNLGLDKEFINMTSNHDL